jgi:hypothetical protein
MIFLSIRSKSSDEGLNSWNDIPSIYWSCPYSREGVVQGVYTWGCILEFCPFQVENKGGKGCRCQADFLLPARKRLPGSRSVRT